ncbi:MAG: hypothetical protein DWQ02_00135 [Bacteroidetes bacterium]|nr:MAG: hypothetical protein DWQ02_00135 [Bacteroidota bacterium]
MIFRDLRNHITAIFFGLTLLTVMSCHDDDPGPADPNPTIHKTEGFFIINEGTFNFGNASVSYYHFDSEEITQEVFKTANGYTPGDVLQDLFIHDDMGYLVLNNSGFIQVVDMETFTSLGIIQPFESPRYFLPVGENKAYVSDLYANSIQVVSLDSGEVTGEIEVPFWTEQMVKAEGRVFVNSPWDVRVDAHDHIYVLDPETDSLIDSIQVGVDPADMVLSENKLWVYCRGSAEEEAPAGLVCVNTQSMEVERTLSFEDHDLGFAARLAFNTAGDTLYYLKNDVFAFPIINSELPATPMVSAEGRILYALGVNPVNGDVLVGDAIDYAQKGKVYMYDSSGGLKQEIDAGVIPAGFVFY